MASLPRPSVSLALPASLAAPAATLASLPCPAGSLTLPLAVPPCLVLAPGFVSAAMAPLATSSAGLPPGLPTGMATRGLFASGAARGGAGAFTVDTGEQTFVVGGVAEFAVDADA